MTELDSLKDLYVDELKELYSAEKQLIDALPKMAQAVSSPELKQALQQHAQVTQGQVQRLEEIFNDLGVSPDGKQCLGMQGLIQEGQELMKQQRDALVKDSSLVYAAQKVEHFEIADYATARTHADMLGYMNAADLLDQTLDEESQADSLLGNLAADLDQAMAPDYEGDIMVVNFGGNMDEEDLEQDDLDDLEDDLDANIVA